MADRWQRQRGQRAVECDDKVADGVHHRTVEVDDGGVQVDRQSNW
jgi:hypothetical protein